MSGKICTDNGGVTIKDCSTLSETGDAGSVCQLPAEPVGNDQQTKSQGAYNFELCEIGIDPFKSLITYADGRTAEIEKEEKGQLTLLSPDGKSKRIVKGLGDDQIKMINALQGGEIGSCNSARGFGTSYALLPTRTKSGETVSWTLKDLDYFRAKLGGTSNRAFFCANTEQAELSEAGTTKTIAINMSEGYQSIVGNFLQGMSSVWSDDCSLEGDKCEIALDSLRDQYKSNFPLSDSMKTFWEKAGEYTLYGMGLLIAGFATGIGFALTGRWFGGHGGGGLTSRATSEPNSNPQQGQDSAALKRLQVDTTAALTPLPGIGKTNVTDSPMENLQISIPAITPMPVPVIAVP